HRRRTGHTAASALSSKPVSGGSSLGSCCCKSRTLADEHAPRSCWEAASSLPSSRGGCSSFKLEKTFPRDANPSTSNVTEFRASVDSSSAPFCNVLREDRGALVLLSVLPRDGVSLLSDVTVVPFFFFLADCRETRV
ncbi:unnamed protein product, partial [Ixodes pacificus]